MIQVFPTGINIIERNLLSTKFEDCSQVMSLVEMLRQLRAGSMILTKVRVEGLEELLAVLRSKDSIRLFRRTIADSADKLSQKGVVMIVPVSKIVMNAELSLLVDDKHLPLAPVFGNRLKPMDHPGYFHAPFNIL
jgi:hypothetical protein